METPAINLLRTQSVLTPEQLLILSKLRLASFIISGLFLGIGIFVGISYVAARTQLNNLENQRITIARQISQQAKKQVLLLNLQDRLPVIGKVMDAQYPWDRVIADLSLLALPPNLKTIAITQNNAITMTVQAKSLEEVSQMVRTSIQLSVDKKIRTPQISSIQISQQGTIDITLTLIPIL